MTDAREPPDSDAVDSAHAAEPEILPTAYERMLVQGAGDVVERCARRIARQFPRIVRENGLITLGDLRSTGHKALYRAARAYKPEQNPEFAVFASYYVTGDMLDAIDDLLFEERVKCAAAKVAENFAAFHTSDGYDVMKHDGDEARRRFRAFAKGVMTATFAAAVEEAAECLDMAELTTRREFEQAVAIVHAASRRLTDTDQQMLDLMYRERLHLRQASEALGVPYGTARARHGRALKLLYDQLVKQGFTSAPRPLVVPDIDDPREASARAQNDVDL